VSHWFPFFMTLLLLPLLLLKEVTFVSLHSLNVNFNLYFESFRSSSRRCRLFRTHRDRCRGPCAAGRGQQKKKKLPESSCAPFSVLRHPQQHSFSNPTERCFQFAQIPCRGTPTDTHTHTHTHALHISLSATVTHSYGTEGLLQSKNIRAHLLIKSHFWDPMILNPEMSDK